MFIRFELLPGYYFDLRCIPLAVCFLYAGFRPSLIIAAAMLAYRLYWGQITFGLIISIPAIITICLILWQSKPLLVEQNNKRNVLAAAAIGLLIGGINAGIVFLASVVTSIERTSYFWNYFVLYSLIHSITFCLTVYIVEQIKVNLRMRTQTFQTDKLHLISELAASFAHEIRNPMTVARGFAQILKQPEITEEKRFVYSEMILDELDTAQSIITNYLTFAKPQLETNELLDARHFIQEAIQSIETYAKMCRVEIELRLEPKMFISANKDKFIQCIIHLSKNGIEAMPDGGKLQIIGTIQNQSVCIDIIDHGVGMTADEVRRLGTPFYSTRKKGTGLGMMVTYRFIQTLNGKIDVASELGKGTCFSLFLPSLHNTSFH